MSHFTVGVFLKEGQILNDAMAPYQENNMSDCDGKYLSFYDQTEEMEKAYESKEQYKIDYPTFELFATEYYGNELYKGKYGYWANPDAEWDWYVVGGRWGNEIKLKDGSKVNAAKVKDIEWDNDFITYAVLTADGVWHSKGKMLWFGISDSTKQDEDKWDKEYYDKFIKDADPELTFVLVDCHI